MRNGENILYAFRSWRLSAVLLFAVLSLGVSCSMSEPPVSPQSAQREQQAVSGESPAASFHLRQANQKSSSVPFDLIAVQQLPDVPFATLYPALLARAQTGELEAKRQLFLVLNECRVSLQFHELPFSPDSFVDPELLTDSGMTSEQFRADLQQRALASTEQTLRQCEKLPVGAIEDAAKWLRDAAESGDPYAQLTYFNYVDLIVGSPQEQLKLPDEVARFNADSMRYLLGLADRQIPEAFGSLSSAYEVGITTPKDLVRAYAYKRIAGDMAPYVGYEWELQRLAEGMTTEQIINAKALARALLKQQP